MPVLAAVVARRGWVPRRALQAECFDARKHDAPPVFDCTCGIYATSRMREVRQLLLGQRYGNNPSRCPIVIGRVAQWGRVVLHEDGARSEYAYPVELFVPAEWNGRSLESEARELGDLYGVRVEVLTAKLMSAFGTSEWEILRTPTLEPPRPWREVLSEAAPC